MAKRDLYSTILSRSKESAKEMEDVDDLFSVDNTVGQNGTKGKREVRSANIALSALHTFHSADIGFKAYDKESLQSLAESIQEDGLLDPIKVRPEPDGNGYEILAGHNRAAACRSLNWTSVPVEIYDVDDARATAIAVTTNVKQRQRLLPSERALAYRALMDARKHQGKVVEDEWEEPDDGARKTMRDKVAAIFDVDRNNVQRHLRLSYLIRPLLNLVDEKAISITSGVQISYYNEDIQRLIYELTDERPAPKYEVMRIIRKTCPEATATRKSFVAAWDAAEQEIEGGVTASSNKTPQHNDIQKPVSAEPIPTFELTYEDEVSETVQPMRAMSDAGAGGATDDHISRSNINQGMVDIDSSSTGKDISTPVKEAQAIHEEMPAKLPVDEALALNENTPEVPSVPVESSTADTQPNPEVISYNSVNYDIETKINVFLKEPSINALADILWECNRVAAAYGWSMQNVQEICFKKYGQGRV